jgi:hypothetical protein
VAVRNSFDRLVSAALDTSVEFAREAAQAPAPIVHTTAVMTERNLCLNSAVTAAHSTHLATKRCALHTPRLPASLRDKRFRRGRTHNGSSYRCFGSPPAPPKLTLN